MAIEGPNLGPCVSILMPAVQCPCCSSFSFRDILFHRFLSELCSSTGSCLRRPGGASAHQITLAGHKKFAFASRRASDLGGRAPREAILRQGGFFQVNPLECRKWLWSDPLSAPDRQLCGISEWLPGNWRKALAHEPCLG